MDGRFHVRIKSDFKFLIEHHFRELFGTMIRSCAYRSSYLTLRASGTIAPCRTTRIGRPSQSRIFKLYPSGSFFSSRASSSSFFDDSFSTTCKGTGQVIFLNSDESGKILLASLAFGDPLTAAMAGLGSFSSSVVAKYTNLDTNMYENGLYSYNGCLVGCAAAVFFCPGSVLGASALTVVGATTSTFVTASLSKSISGMPQWTLAFNLVTLTALLRSPPTPSPDALVPAATSALDLFLSPLVGLSQIFVVESVLSGAGVLLAIGIYSPQLAGHALMGSAVGCVSGVLLGAPVGDIAAGLWGYNSALTSMGTAVFFRNTRSMQALSVAGAAATALTFGACQNFFTVPCLTLPFCWVMSGCYYLGKDNVVPGLSLAANPHSPEKNKQ